MLRAIVAIDVRGAIGYQGNLCFACPEDLTFFKNTTWGGIVVVGSTTLKTFPGGLPLLGRTTWILSRSLNVSWTSERPCRVFRTLESLTEAISSTDQDVWLSGGESLYRQLLPLCAEAVITRFETRCDQADAFFPDIFALPQWKVFSEVRGLEFNGLTYSRLWLRQEL